MSKLRSESYLISKKVNIPADIVDFVIDEFESQLRYYLVHPEECPGGILLHNLCSFKIDQYAEQRRINLILNGKNVRNHHIGHRRQELLNDIVNNERQVKKRRNNVRHD